MANCNIRFMDNQKISSYTVTDEEALYPFENALNFDVRSKIFKANDNSDWRLVADLGFPDQVTALCLFAPLGEVLGITREATIKLQADNIADWSSPDYEQTLTLTSDEQLIFFIDQDDAKTYRYWSLYIDDPTNPDKISFGICYMGDYTTTQFRNISNGFSWALNDPSTVSKSINGTAYFDVKTRFDSFQGLQMGYVQNNDRQTIERLFQRVGTFTKMPISLDPEGKTVGENVNTLTRFARFSAPLSRQHAIYDYYGMSFSLEECI